MQGLKISGDSPMDYNEETAATTHDGQAGIDNENTNGWEGQMM